MGVPGGSESAANRVGEILREHRAVGAKRARLLNAVTRTLDRPVRRIVWELLNEKADDCWTEDDTAESSISPRANKETLRTASRHVSDDDATIIDDQPRDNFLGAAADGVT